MNYKILFFIFAILGVAFFTNCGEKENLSQNGEQDIHEDLKGYWTCSMHPQVHQHEKGKCPICGMDLIHVDSSKTDKITNQNEIKVTDNQLNLAGIGRHTVSRKDIIISLDVFGNVLSSKKVVFEIFEPDLSLVKINSEFFGFLNSTSQKELKGKIVSIDSKINPTTRTLKVFGIMDEPVSNSIINGGFYAQIKIQLKNQIVIPETAVLHTGKRDLVYLISSDNLVSPLSVTLGNKSLGEYQILSGLNEGDVISTGPNFLLDSESKIRGGND